MKVILAFFILFYPCLLHKLSHFRILCNRKNKNRRKFPFRIQSTYPCGETQEVSMNCCLSGNTTLWILIALIVLGSKDGFFCSGIFNGCGLPIVVALLYCLYKNGTLASVLTPPASCCDCHCNCR